MTDTPDTSRSEPVCDDTVHRWSDDFTDGDTCQCGEWYWFDERDDKPRRIERTPKEGA